MNPQHLAILIESACEVRFEKGDLLFREGEPADHFFLIETGRVALEAHEPANGTVLVQHVEAGEVLGWSWLFAPFVWHFQARAATATGAISLAGAHLLTAAEGDHDSGYELMKRVAQVLIHRLQATHRLLVVSHGESALEG